MTRRVMRLVDPSTGRMECRVCGSVHWARLRSGGHYFRGSWQCQNGCEVDDIKPESGPKDRSATKT
jgi:hypothetical protein